MTPQIRRAIDDHEGRSAALQAAPHGDRPAYGQLFDRITLEKESRDALCPGAGQFLRQHIAGSLPLRSLVASGSGRQADHRIDIGQCRRLQREPAAARISGDDDFLVSIPARFGDALCHEAENVGVLLFKIGNRQPVDPHDIPRCDVGHLGEDDQDRIQVGVPYAISMEIEEEALRPFRAAPFDDGRLPFRPDEAKVLGATGAIDQQQTGQNDQHSAKELHETASTLTRCTVETVSWCVGRYNLV